MPPHDAAAPQPLQLGDDALLPLLLRVLAARGSITIALADVPGFYGVTELDRAMIFLDRQNSSHEHRATLAHELAHLDLDDGEPITPAVERAVDRLAAALLVPTQDALIVRAGADAALVAENLGVDETLMWARVGTMLEAEADGVG